jgi:Voltage-dependent anion channel
MDAADRAERSRARDALRRVRDAVPSVSGAVVMGTGIVAIALSDDGRRTLARVLLALAALAWVIVTSLLAARALSPRRPRYGDPALLTCVAGTAVLGELLLAQGAALAAAPLLVLALALWLVLLPPVFAAGFSREASSFMLAVSTQSLAVLAASLAAHEHLRWVLIGALVAIALGLVAYIAALTRIDPNQLRSARGEHWIAGGALAIAALAASQATLAASALHTLNGARVALETVSIVLWALSLVWLPVLLASEVLWPRLRYDLRRWGTVFPVGMYAACTFAVAQATRWSGLADAAREWLWVAVALWLLVATATLRHLSALWRRPAR